MDSEVMVSIICNAYNQKDYIRDALNGFVMQETTFPFEILIHDDASTDGTADIIREYESKYPHLFKPIYQTENQYSKHDRTIIKLQSGRVKGKYVAMCEGDDYWIDPKKLQKQFDFMEAHPEYTLCGCSTRWLNVLTGKEQDMGKTDEDKDLSFEDFLLTKGGRPFQYASFFMRADLWVNKPVWGFPVGDLPLTYYASMKGKVRMLADVMCVYRWFSKGSWTEREYNDAARIKYHEQFLTALDKMNRETQYEYDELIQKKIAQQKYELALAKHDYKALKSPELAEIYKNRKLSFRVKDYVHCKMPGLFTRIMKVISNTR